jgi:CubicO group peptidase (beta-lactamase class C family)
MQRLKFLLVFFLLICCCNISDTSSFEAVPEIPEEVITLPPLSDEKIHKIDSLLARVLKNYRFNGNALVAYKGHPVFRSSNGFAHLYTKDTLNLNTVFQLASVSKGFTAMAVLILHQRGLLDIYDTVQKHIPEFPFKNITVVQLLQHTAGLQNYMYFVDHYWDEGKLITLEDVLDLINNNNPGLNFRPGRRHQYNNTSYAMAALLVERVSGISYHQFLKENIFDPLEMRQTFAWNPATWDTITNIAQGFTRRGWRYRIFNHNPLDQINGDKSVYSTIDDMLKWDQALYTDKLINDSLLKLAFTKTITPRSREHDYGLGWRLRETNGRQVIYHNGLWNGFTSSLTRYVEDSITVIVLNNTNAPVASIVNQMYGVLKKEILDEQNTEHAIAEETTQAEKVN